VRSYFVIIVFFATILINEVVAAEIINEEKLFRLDENGQLTFQQTIQMTFNHGDEFEKIIAAQTGSAYWHMESGIVKVKTGKTEKQFLLLEENSGTIRAFKPDINFENGGIAEIQIVFKRGFIPNDFSQKINLINEVKTGKLLVVVIIPSSMNLYYDVAGRDEKCDFSSDSLFKTYSWHFDSIPFLSKNIPVFPDHLKFPDYLAFSTQPLKTDYFRTIALDEFKFEATDCLRHIADSVRVNVPKDEWLPVLQSLLLTEGFDCCQDKATHAAKEINPKLEQAALLTTLLQAVGYKSVPVLVYPYDKPEDVHSFNSYCEILIRVHSDPQKWLYLPVDKIGEYNLKFTIGGLLVFPLYSEMRSFAPYVADTYISGFYKVTLARKRICGQKVNGSVQLSGKFFDNYQYLADSQQWFNAFLSKIGEVKKATMKEVLFRSDDSISFSYSAIFTKTELLDWPKLNKVQDGLVHYYTPVVLQENSVTRKFILFPFFKKDRKYSDLKNKAGKYEILKSTKVGKVSTQKNLEISAGFYQSERISDLNQLLESFNTE